MEKIAHRYCLKFQFPVAIPMTAGSATMGRFRVRRKVASNAVRFLA
jgi:hypothetical protein